MSSAYASSATITTTTTSTSSSFSRPAKAPKAPKAPKSLKAPIVSSGRGGAGNKRLKSALKLDLGDEAEIMERRRQEASLNPRVKVKYTGRGGSGNIRAASQAQSIPFDISADPDDDYEQIVLQGAQKAKKDKLPSTGRGGLGNLNRPRSKSFVVSSAKGKEKPRRRRSVSSSRFTVSTTSIERYELQRLTAATSGLSLEIPTSRFTPAPSPNSPLQSLSSRSSLPAPSSSSPAALYMLSTRASTTTSLPASSSCTPVSSPSSGLSLLPVVATTHARSAPSSPLRCNPRATSGLPLLSTRTSTTSGSGSSLPTRPASQSTASFSSQSARASTSTLGLLSPPASPIVSEASRVIAGQRASLSVSEPGRNIIPQHKLHKTRSHDAPSKWWKMGGRRRVVVSLQDVASDRRAVVSSSSDVSSGETPVLWLRKPTTEEVALSHLQEVGMHAMEVRMRMREERLSIIRNSQRSVAPQSQEYEDDVEYVVEDDSQESDRNDAHPLPSVPEEDDGGQVSFLDFY